MNNLRDIEYLSDKEKKILLTLKERLVELFGESIKKIVLFGSKARGDYDENSDIDLAIIVSDLNKEKKDKILKEIINLEIEYNIPLSTLILSEEDFKLLKERERRIAYDIEKEGIEL